MVPSSSSSSSSSLLSSSSPPPSPSSCTISIVLVRLQCQLDFPPPTVSILRQMVQFLQCVLAPVLYVVRPFAVWSSSFVLSYRIVFLNLYSAAHGQDYSVALPVRRPSVEIGFEEGEG